MKKLKLYERLGLLISGKNHIVVFPGLSTAWVIFRNGDKFEFDGYAYSSKRFDLVVDSMRLVASSGSASVKPDRNEIIQLIREEAVRQGIIELNLISK